MKKNYILGAFAAASLAFTACSSDELNEDINGGTVTPNVPEEVVLPEFKELGEFSLSAPFGSNNNNGSAQSRSIKDIDKEGRPIGKYPLDSVYCMSVKPMVQPTSFDIAELFDPQYGLEGFGIMQIPANNSVRLYYHVAVSHKNPGASNSGKIYISTHRNPKNASERLEFDLSVFELNKLKNQNQIDLNDFAYDQVDPSDGIYRGSAMRYSSYNPSKLSKTPKALTLPRVDYTLDEYKQYEFLANPTSKHAVERNLVTEIQDRYFLGTEFLFAATDDQVYILETKENLGENGGHFRYYENKEFPVPNGKVRQDSINLRRLTTMVNLNLMVTDGKTWSSASYFNPDSYNATINNFKKRHSNIDLSTLECKYATFDGFNASYSINENPVNRIKNVSDPSRMVMWAEGLVTERVNGTTIERNCEQSMDLSFYLKNGLQRGYGLKGNSYTVAFPGYSTDTESQKIQFYVTLGDGKVTKNIKIVANIDDKSGIAFSQNTAHDVCVYVDANDLEKAWLKLPATSRSINADNYAVINLPSENVIVAE